MERRAKTIFTRSIKCGKRIYYANICVDSKGDKFLEIKEKGMVRGRVFLHSTQLQTSDQRKEFIKLFKEVWRELFKEEESKCQ